MSCVYKVITKKADFDASTNGCGGSPHASMFLASNGKFYGTTYRGAQYDHGSIYEYNYITNTITKKVDFQGSTIGRKGEGSFVEVSGKLYGTTCYGGLNNYGTLIEYDLVTEVCTKKLDFDWAVGRWPYGSMIVASNGKLYGMTKYGGVYGAGVIYEYDTSIDSYALKYSFNSQDSIYNGYFGVGTLIQATNGKLYGMTQNGGQYSKGTLFEFDLVLDTLINKIDFNGNNGEGPIGQLIQLSNGLFYGTTYSGGLYGKGTMFEYSNVSNVLTKKIDFFSNIDGSEPNGNLIKASNGKFYGVTLYGGVYDHGVLFEYDQVNNVYTKKVDFKDSLKGRKPCGSLFQASNGKIYGMTQSGGLTDHGVMFEFDPLTGIFIKKVDFNLNGKHPYGSLMQASNGKLYGITSSGGLYYDGALFEFDYLTDTYTIKKYFNENTDGRDPHGTLVEANNGKLYGLSRVGGISGEGTIYEYDFVLDTLTIKHSFNDWPSECKPIGSLINASNGKLYGMTPYGGQNLYGALFEYDPINDIYAKKIDFDDAITGEYAVGKLLQSSNGDIFGVGYTGGEFDLGTIFKYDIVTETCTKTHDFDYSDAWLPVEGFIEGDFANASFVTSSNNISSSPFNVSFINTSADNYNSFIWNFGDGNNDTTFSPTHLYDYNGSYTVTLLALDTINNTSDTAMQTIVCSGGVNDPCGFMSELTQNQLFADICFGDSIRLSATPNNNVTYSWKLDGVIIPGESDSVLYAKNEGLYTAVLSNSICDKPTTNFFSLLVNIPSSYVVDIVSSINSCNDDSVALKAPIGYTEYLWSNGRTGQIINVGISGTYSVQAIDNNNCISVSDDVAVNVSLSQVPEICIVGVDYDVYRNIIKWEPENTTAIDSFKVFRADSLNEVFQLIEKRAYNLAPEFIDNISDVDSGEVFYKISAIDECGNESFASPVHKTMYLKVMVMPNNNTLLTWKPYEGISFNSYRIYKGTDSTNMSLFASVASSNNSFEDISSSSAFEYYQIVVVLPYSCNNNVVTSRSNIVNTKYALDMSTNPNMYNNIEINVFPNPNNGIFSLEINNSEYQDLMLKVYTASGSEVYSDNFKNKEFLKKKLNLSNLSSGVYYLQLFTNDGNSVYRNKIVIIR